jgi:hypothetical protein
MGAFAAQNNAPFFSLSLPCTSRKLEFCAGITNSGKDSVMQQKILSRFTPAIDVGYPLPPRSQSFNSAWDAHHIPALREIHLHSSHRCLNA